jgi:hypothetical protein
MKYNVLSVAGCTLTAHNPDEEIKPNTCNVNGITVG